jgi:hypothetical protein
VVARRTYKGDPRELRSVCLPGAVASTGFWASAARMHAASGSVVGKRFDNRNSCFCGTVITVKPGGAHGGLRLIPILVAVVRLSTQKVPA